MPLQKTPPQAGKRERLIQAARRSYHRRGMVASTIKLVAAEADVPLGNVYYYFPTREALTRAVVEDALSGLRRELARFEQHADTRDRLIAFLAAASGRAQEAARYGCPFVALASETHKQGDPSAALAADILRDYQNWFTDQWRASWNRELTAEEFFAALQGAYALAHGTNDPALFARLLARLRERVQQLG